jgi:hypothetical protein
VTVFIEYFDPFVGKLYVADPATVLGHSKTVECTLDVAILPVFNRF